MADQPDRPRVVARGAGSSGRGPSVGVVIAVALALLVGGAVGRFTAPDERDGGGGPAQPPAGRSGEGPGPTRTSDGVPVGYERSRAGAVAAATAYVSVLSSPLVLDTRRREAAIRRMATDGFAPRLIEQTAAANSELQRGPVGAGLRAGQATVFQGSQLGYRVRAYTSDQASVSIWTLAIVGNAEQVPPRVGWQTNTFALRWTGNDWKLDGYQGRGGPVPATPESLVPTAPSDFVQQVSGLRGYRNVP